MATRLIKLNNSLIQSAINNEALTHSPKTVGNIYGLLTSILRLYHPALHAQLKITLPKKQKKEMNILTSSEMAVLLKSIEGKTIEVPVLLSAWLGLRQSEICGLKWDCLDFKNNIMTIKHAIVMDKNYKNVLKDTKTYSSTRKLKVPDFIMNKIKSLPRNGDFVITIQGKSIYEGFKKALMKNNLPEIRFHDLRHFNASVMLQLNIPDKYAMERGGWATNTTMKNVYQHTFSDERKAVDNLVDSYFLSLLSHELSHEI